ncbi:CAP domain-containing protein [Nonomuraea fuscirosea]|uniref:CAP domain-containing protein n=1 Tax=Nonomuraea fuscirosea TaxID=1291556 RepID=UPI0033F68EBC
MRRPPAAPGGSPYAPFPRPAHRRRHADHVRRTHEHGAGRHALLVRRRGGDGAGEHGGAAGQRPAAKKKGCRALKHHPRLHRAAHAHAADMAVHGYFSHDSRDGRGYIDRVKAAGYKRGGSWAELLGKGQRTPAVIVGSWMNDPGSKASLLNCKFAYTGVGAVEDANGVIVWTQLFATK